MDPLTIKEVFDAGEAIWLLSQGWKLEEVRILTRWSHGCRSETHSYVVGLPEHAGRDVAAVSLAL